MADGGAIFDHIIVDVPILKRGTKPINGRSMTVNERVAKHRARKKEDRISDIAILDFETDPFDPEKETPVFPFLACLYSDNFEPIVIWDENPTTFIDKVLDAIEGLPGEYTIYAHNGGKFDFMFFVHRLRGQVMFKGRGIMSAKVGRHELRDSFHIIPERLANWQKDDFDYHLLKKNKRNKHRDEIIRYCVNDCRYLLEIVQHFVKEFGFKISIGQAAMSALRRHYKVASLSPFSDEYLRDRFYFGGRVECLQGRGHFAGPYKLYDVNSMYPHVMASYQHPVGNDFTRRPGKPTDKTAFVHLTCRNNGALICRDETGATTATRRDGEFYTTIWEYNVAKKYGLIWNVKFIDCIDWTERSDFSKFIHPLYHGRQELKGQMKVMAKATGTDTREYRELKKDDMIIKYVLNSCYGKFAQNPRRFKEHYITDPNGRPPDWWFENTHQLDDDAARRMRLPSFYNDQYAIWERPNPAKHFNNVATAASITGAARAVLLEAIQNADDPIYCDTDSIICKELYHVQIDGAQLGAWDLEQEFDDVLIAGKKLYATKVKGKEDGQRERLKVKSKGVQLLEIEKLDGEPIIRVKQDKAWAEMQRIIDGAIIEVAQRAPTLTRYGEQFYMSRHIRATAPRQTRRIRHARNTERAIA